MNIAWTKGITDEGKKNEFIDLLKNSNTVLGKQRVILEDIKTSLQKQMSASAQYDQPNWEYRQADFNGCIRTVQNIIDLITIK